ncbi:hypothetical protein [Marinobacter sp.]|uniref:hypothetical protein n=1 Tax=Marinobacter sp. TaxID=50741 RepID=UPI0035646EB4
MKPLRSCLAGALLLASSAAWTSESASQSYESCSVITSEYLTVLQLASRGLNAEALKQSLPGISSKAKQRVETLVGMAQQRGIAEAYSAVHSEYARCAKKVFDQRGLPAEGTREAHFHYCAGENKVRYEIILAAAIGAEEQEVIDQVRPVHRDAAEAIFAMNEQTSPEAMLDQLATELKECISQRP